MNKETKTGITLNLVRSEAASGAEMLNIDNLSLKVFNALGIKSNPVLLGIVKSFLQNYRGFYRVELSFNGVVIWTSKTFYLT